MVRQARCAQLPFQYRAFRMNRRSAAVYDRHAMLAAHSYPTTSSTFGTPSSASLDEPRRMESPFENPYSAPSRGVDQVGAPKKEPSGQSGFVSLFSGTIGQQNSAADLEEQNDARLNGLSERIKMLKDVRMKCSHTDLDGYRKRSAGIYDGDEFIGGSLELTLE